MTDAELTRVERGLAAKPQFGERAAEFFAAGVRRNPTDTARLERIVPRYPGLAQCLLRHLPDEEWLTDFVEGWHTPSPARSAGDYLEATCEERDFGEERWLEKKAIVDTGAASDAELVDELVAYGELSAGAQALINLHDPVGAHLREERIEALASLLALFATPDAYTAEPVD